MKPIKKSTLFLLIYIILGVISTFFFTYNIFLNK